MKLTLVKKQEEAKNTYSFFFRSDIKLSWQAGQYLYLTLGETTKQFTISSSPTEEFIQVTTRIREESEFKQALNNVQIGEEVEARAPFGTFALQSHESKNMGHVFLAGGIGITPFRSMIKYNVDENLKLPMYLIYSNSDSEFVFKKELDQWQNENEFIKIYYHNSGLSGHLDQSKLNTLLSNHLQISTIWVVGPAAFVNSMEDILENFEIDSDMIRTEKFIGY